MAENHPTSSPTHQTLSPRTTTMLSPHSSCSSNSTVDTGPRSDPSQGAQPFSKSCTPRNAENLRWALLRYATSPSPLLSLHLPPPPPSLYTLSTIPPSLSDIIDTVLKISNTHSAHHQDKPATRVEVSSEDVKEAHTLGRSQSESSPVSPLPSPARRSSFARRLMVSPCSSPHESAAPSVLASSPSHCFHAKNDLDGAMQHEVLPPPCTVAVSPSPSSNITPSYPTASYPFSERATTSDITQLSSSAACALLGSPPSSPQSFSAVRDKDEEDVGTPSPCAYNFVVSELPSAQPSSSSSRPFLSSPGDFVSKPSPQQPTSHSSASALYHRSPLPDLAPSSPRSSLSASSRSSPLRPTRRYSLSGATSPFFSTSQHTSRRSSLTLSSPTAQVSPSRTQSFSQRVSVSETETPQPAWISSQEPYQPADRLAGGCGKNTARRVPSGNRTLECEE